MTKLLQHGAGFRELRATNVYDVKADFGAKGDGVTDDSAAIQAVESAASGSGVLWFPPGTYKVSSNSTITSSVVLSQGARISPDAGVAVTFSGDALLFEGETTHATGSGTVTFSGALFAKSRITWVQSGETFNEALSRTSGERHIMLPPGTTTFDAEWDDGGNATVVEGAGMDVSVLQADGVARFYSTTADAPNEPLIFRNLTLDMNDVSGNGELFDLDNGGQRRIVHLRNVRIQNINLGGSTGVVGMFDLAAGSSEKILVIDGASEIRLDTVTNRPSNHNYQLVRGVIDYLYVGPDVKHIYPTSGQTAGTNDFQGYLPNINKRAMVDGIFVRPEQYAVSMGLNDADAVIEVRAHAIDIGDADCFRVNSQVTGGGGTVRFRGSISGAPGGGDRGYIVSGGNAPAVVDMDVTVERVLVPIHIRGGDVVRVRAAIKDSGDLSEADPGASAYRPAIQIDDNIGEIGSLVMEVNIRNTASDRWMDPAIDLNSGGGGWGAGPHIISGVATGYEANQVEDGTPGGATLITGRLYGDGLETYSESNVSTDRTYDADSTNTAELADILGTLIRDLRARGLID